MAMWHLYGGGYQGVAVRSRFGLLDAELPEKFDTANREVSVFLGPVKYVDYLSETEQIPQDKNVYGPFMCKGLAYQHESEVRAIFTSSMAGDPCLGYVVPVDLPSLVEEIVVSPLAPPWFAEVVEQSCSDTGHSFEIKESVMRVPPVY